MTLRQEIEVLASDLSEDRLLVQGAGGNISWKEGGVLWVSRSGFRLDEAKSHDIFVDLDLERLRARLGNNLTGDFSNLVGSRKGRPSIETPLHALHPRTVVVHLHAVSAISFLIRENWRDEISELLSDTRSNLFVDYFRPGEPLAKEIHQHSLIEKGYELIFLKNHGIVFASDTVPGVRGLIDEVVCALQRDVREFVPEPVQRPSDIDDWLPPGNSDLHQLATNKKLYERVLEDWAITPDHVVFLGPEPVCMSSEDEISRELEKISVPFVFVEGKGVFATAAASRAALEQLRCFFDVMVRQPDHVAVSSLSDSQVSELVDWEAEKFRQAIAR